MSRDVSSARWMKTRVQSYAAYRGDEEPRSLDVGNHRLDVLEIQDRWNTPDHNYFKVRVRGGKFYVLRCATGRDEWESAPFLA